MRYETLQGEGDQAFRVRKDKNFEVQPCPSYRTCESAADDGLLGEHQLHGRQPVKHLLQIIFASTELNLSTSSPKVFFRPTSLSSTS